MQSESLLERSPSYEIHKNLHECHTILSIFSKPAV